jgi:hypothetical protein
MNSSTLAPRITVIGTIITRCKNIFMINYIQFRGDPLDTDPIGSLCNQNSLEFR